MDSIVELVKRNEQLLLENAEALNDEEVEQEDIDEYLKIQGATKEELSAFENQFQIRLPEDFKTVYSYKNGSGYMSLIWPQEGFYRGYRLLSLKEIIKLKSLFQNKNCKMTEFPNVIGEKHKGNPARPLEAHHERQKEQYASNPDIDTSRSKYNFHIVKPEGRYYHFIQSRIEQAGCRTRRDSTRFVDTLITASPEFFKKKSPKEIQAFFQRAAEFLIGRVGRENIVSAVVHMDEKTPHLHLVFVPLTEDNRLCAKEIIGNRASLTKWQDDFHAYMVEKYPDLERGESASKTGRKHIPTRLFKQAVNLSKQARAIEATLDGITPFNAGKKKEEALSLLKKWFPQMENFSGQLKKYKVTINDLLAENEQLEARAKAIEKGKMKDTMERAKLESELKDIQRLVDRIPPEVLAELKRQQRHTRER